MNFLLGIVTRNPMVLIWIAVGAFVVGAASGGGTAWTVQGWRLDAVQAKFDGFIATTKAEGEAAKKLANDQAAEDKRKKEQADEENARTLSALRADVKRLRDARPGGSFVPAAASGSLRPELACFDRSELERAIRGLDLGVQGLVDEGSEDAVSLNTSKSWAQS